MSSPPLVVDLDGTLLCSDLLLESGMVFVRSSPLESLRPFGWPRCGSRWPSAWAC